MHLCIQKSLPVLPVQFPPLSEEQNRNYYARGWLSSPAPNRLHKRFRVFNVVVFLSFSLAWPAVRSSPFSHAPWLAHPRWKCTDKRWLAPDSGRVAARSSIRRLPWLERAIEREWERGVATESETRAAARGRDHFRISHLRWIRRMSATSEKGANKTIHSATRGLS